MKTNSNYALLILLVLIAALCCFGLMAAVPCAYYAYPKTPFFELPASAFAEADGSLSDAGSTLAAADGSLSDAGDPLFQNGAEGILRIEEPSVTLPLYSCDIYEEPERAQEIVDGEDAAAFFLLHTKSGQIRVIADHEGQAFSVLSKVQKNTVCSITHADGTEEHYQCTKCTGGRNTGSALLFSDGTDSGSLGSGTLLMYTCNGDWRDVTIRVWTPLDAQS